MLSHSQHNAILSHIIKLIFFFFSFKLFSYCSRHSRLFLDFFFVCQVCASFHYVFVFFFVVALHLSQQQKLLLNCYYCSPFHTMMLLKINFFSGNSFNVSIIFWLIISLASPTFAFGSSFRRGMFCGARDF